MSNQYGKIPLVSGQQIIEDVGGTGLSGIVIGNESGLTCTVTLQGAGVKKTLYPGTVDKFEVPKGRSWTGNMQIDPTADLNNIISWPSSHVYVDTYGVGEVITGQYPFQLNRAGNIGNAVNFVSGVSTGVQNDNNAAGTQFIEATVLGSPSSNEVHTVDGAGWIGRWINPTFTKTFQWFATGATALMLGAAGLITEILGNLLVDGVINLLNAKAIQWNDSGGTARTIIQVDGSNNTQLFGVLGTDKIQFLKHDGTLEGSVDVSNGNAAFNGSVSNVNGALSGFFPITPFHLTTNPTVNSGVTTTLDCTTGTGVPVGAKAVIIAGGISSGTIGAYVTYAPNGATLGQYGGNVATLGGTSLAMFSPITARIAANGKLDVHANAGNIVLQDWYIIGYII